MITKSLGIIRWIAGNWGIIPACQAMLTLADIGITGNYWKKHKIGNMTLLGGLSMIDEVFIKKVYDVYLSTDTPVILDLGANVGTYVMYALQRYKAPMIIAYEPSKKALDCLRENIHGQDVIIWSYAVGGERSGKSVLYHSYASGFSSLILDTNSIKDSESVAVVTLEDVYKQNSIEHIDILKMDVEGMEYQILSANESLLRKIGNIVLEYHSRDIHDKLIELFARNGFIVVRDDNKDIGIMMVTKS